MSGRRLDKEARRELARLLGEGTSVRRVADRLGISKKTAELWQRDGQVCSCGQATLVRSGVCRDCARALRVCGECGTPVAAGTGRCRRCASGVRPGGFECRRCRRVLPGEAFSLRKGGKVRPVRSLCRACEYTSLLERTSRTGTAG